MKNTVVVFEGSNLYLGTFNHPYSQLNDNGGDIIYKKLDISSRCQKSISVLTMKWSKVAIL